MYDTGPGPNKGEKGYCSWIIVVIPLLGAILGKFLTQLV